MRTKLTLLNNKIYGKSKVRSTNSLKRLKALIKRLKEEQDEV